MFEETLYREAFSGKKILLGITGSIAAFKAIDLIRSLTKAGAQVKVVATENALRFVSKLTLETLSQNKLVDSMWDDAHSTHHIDTARWGDLFLIAPASANTIAKIAHGICDDVLSTEVLSFRGPVIICPAMNPTMWANLATQANIQTLKSRGVEILSPANGLTSCGEIGEGRLLEPYEILRKIAERKLSRRSVAKQKNLLISLGGMEAHVDDARVFRNKSSGKMGAALAWVAVSRGYTVHCLAGKISHDVLLPESATIDRIETIEDLDEALTETFPNTDYFVSAMAVLDFTPDLSQVPTGTGKIKKADFPNPLSFRQTQDYLHRVSSEKKPHQVVVGFAAETKDLEKNGLRKVQDKGCDAIFVNSIQGESSAFGADDNEGIWIDKKGKIQKLARANKFQIAHQILDLMEGI
jgi:phosphopantothenoylcysteine decarboxylase / phosphopantothenate---cysteine ligase